MDLKQRYSYDSRHGMMLIVTKYIIKKGRDFMDIASLSTALSSIQTGNDVGVLMLSKQLDYAQTQGDSMVKALEQSVAPHLGGNIDVQV